jgi:serum/glucocorticoid-regulated kinase 2
MEYIDGWELYNVLQRVNQLDETAARFVLAEVVLGIQYLHEELQIIYRDLKPENVMLTRDGHVKIIDFGLSCLYTKETSYAAGDSRTSRRSAQATAGTAEYFAPEIVFGAPQTKDLDFWTMGVFLYELLCGIPPFGRVKERNYRLLANAILVNNPVFPSHLSREAVAIIKAFLQNDP